ncbi:hypothetical protein ACXR0O_11715 [Verrucomicrobiota bacterium sgz303538]
MLPESPLRIILCGFAIAIASSAFADAPLPPTPLASADLDPAAFVTWADGKESREKLPENGPRDVVWTKDSRVEWAGVTFGTVKNPGARHLRIGFKTPQPVGTVLVRAGGRLSVLKPNAPYPGDLTNEDHWLPADRISGQEISREEVGREEYATWVLPPRTTTRALRFTHVAQPADPRYDGWLGGALLFPERLTNVAPQAIAVASTHDEAAAKLNNSKDDNWKSWDNGKEGVAQPISPAKAEWVELVWSQPTTLGSLAMLTTGLSSGEVQAYSGPADRHPREALEGDWKLVKRFSDLPNGYPFALWPNVIAFEQPVTTRAVRVRVTGTTVEGHSHLKGNTKGGKRIWLGELQAFQPLGDKDLRTALVLPAHNESGDHPPIPIRFTLKEPGYVSLVVEDSTGKRVRNLVSETKFPAGENVAWWDGTDDLGRDQDAARHGLFHIPEQPVVPGNYRVRGLFHKGLELRYEFSVYNAGTPAWETEDKTGGWLTNHTPPQAALFIPGNRAPGGKQQVLLGSAVSEGGAGLAWVDMEGHKLGGRGWIGGNWTAAPYLARDDGKNALSDIYAYVGAAWTSSQDNKEKRKGELRITGLTAKGDKPVLKYPFTAPVGKTQPGDDHWVGQLKGLAVHDGLIVASMERIDALLIADARKSEALGTIPMKSPRGVAFDAQGRLLLLAEDKLLRVTLPSDLTPYLASDATRSQPLPAEVLVAKDLQDPHGITLDAQGNIYISERGNSHQVKVFTPQGKLVRAIGHAGEPKAGAYDPEHMNNPHGLAIDERQQLWVTENDFQPKRVSVWSLDGKLLRAFYGPGRYGGGGTLDPRDKRRFYYDGVEFRLDWEKGTNTPVSVFHRLGSGNAAATSFSSAAPETPIYLGERQYMTNCYNANPTGGPSTAAIWLVKDRVAAPVASMGHANDWPLLKGDEFKSLWPKDVDLRGDYWRNVAHYVWSDLNDDGRPQLGEITIMKGRSGGITVLQDLSFVAARLDNKAVRFRPQRFTPGGAPVYDFSKGEVLAEGAHDPASSGGDQVLVSPNGWTIMTTSPEPFAREGFAGLKDGQPMWQYPSVWPGLHASHEAPVPDQPGQVIGSTRLLGSFITPRQSDVGPIWAINGNMGPMYLFTADGLFVSQLFLDSRQGESWSMPKAERGMLLNTLTTHDENFWPSITQTSDGNVYLVDGGRTSLVRVDGLEHLRRIPEVSIQVTEGDLAKAQAWRVQAEAGRQQARGTGTLTVSLRNTAPAVDGKVDDWANADWAVIDRRGVAANFNSDSKPYDVTGAVAIAGDRLYAAWRTQDAELLKNSGETPQAPFKTGGCLDLMLGTDSSADPKRSKPVAGDLRLLITKVNGKTLAVVYRGVVPGTKDPVPFSSPWRTMTIDRVEDVSASVQLASAVEKDEKGKVKSAIYEISIPLASLGLKPSDEQTIKGDIGILRGQNFRTLQRVYWNNKATAITADVPSEAELTPGLWGKWQFKNAGE